MRSRRTDLRQLRGDDKREIRVHQVPRALVRPLQVDEAGLGPARRRVLGFLIGCHRRRGLHLVGQVALRRQRRVRAAPPQIRSPRRRRATDSVTSSRTPCRRGYPTIKYFAPGSTEPEDYNGGRTASDIVKFAEEKATENLAPPEVVQVTSEASVEAGCAHHPLCVIAFLPHILDCDANCRNGHIEDMTKLGDKYKKKDWGWLWSEGMAQPDLESSVEVGGFGYPAMVVLR